MVAAVALHEAVAQYVPQIRIKWPNDLTADGAKLAGILLERQTDAVVIGFGVNLAHHPDLPSRAVTSLKALTGSGADPGVFAEVLAQIFASWLARWRAEGHAPILDAWRAAAHPVGTALSTPEGDGLFEGLEDDGALRLRLPDGSLRIVHAGDVFLI